MDTRLGGASASGGVTSISAANRVAGSSSVAMRYHKIKLLFVALALVVILMIILLQQLMMGGRATLAALHDAIFDPEPPPDDDFRPPEIYIPPRGGAGGGGGGAAEHSDHNHGKQAGFALYESDLGAPEFVGRNLPDGGGESAAAWGETRLNVGGVGTDWDEGGVGGGRRASVAVGCALTTRQQVIYNHCLNNYNNNCFTAHFGVAKYH